MDSAFFAISQNGWTNTEIACCWIEHVFDAQTKLKAGSSHRLLLIDGHSSHHNYPFLKYFLDNRIIPFCLPPHATRDLQPLDVGVFGPYQLYYGQTVDEELRLSHGVLNIG
jgi:DDE superfamily endonuclease